MNLNFFSGFFVEFLFDFLLKEKIFEENEKFPKNFFIGFCMLFEEIIVKNLSAEERNLMVFLLKLVENMEKIEINEEISLKIQKNLKSFFKEKEFFDENTIPITEDPIKIKRILAFYVKIKEFITSEKESTLFSFDFSITIVILIKGIQETKFYFTLFTLFNLTLGFLEKTSHFSQEISLKQAKTLENEGKNPENSI